MNFIFDVDERNGSKVNREAFNLDTDQQCSLKIA